MSSSFTCVKPWMNSVMKHSFVLFDQRKIWWANSFATLGIWPKVDLGEAIMSSSGRNCVPRVPPLFTEYPSLTSIMLSSSCWSMLREGSWNKSDYVQSFPPTILTLHVIVLNIKWGRWSLHDLTIFHISSNIEFMHPSHMNHQIDSLFLESHAGKQTKKSTMHCHGH